MSAPKTASFAAALLLAFGSGVYFTTAGADLLGLRGLLAESHADLGPGDTRLAASPATLEDAFTEVAARVNPTVVQITSSRYVSRSAARGQMPPEFLEQLPPQFRRYFGAPDGAEQAPDGTAPDGTAPDGGDGGEGRAPEDVQQGLGSGAIVRADGYIVTNNHVIEGAEDLTVHFFDGTELPATVVGTDPTSDLAVIKVDKTGLPTISTGPLDGVRVGQWVMAFGSPLSTDFSNTVTAGIVSAIGRYANLPDRQSGQPRLESFIQTDAAINPGNSGGPLVNLRGEMIGINSAIYTRTGGNQGIGFAIPVDVVRSTMEQLIASGSVRRARLGVSIGPVSGALARARSVPAGAAQVGEVSPGTAAARAGLRPNDIIVAIDGRELRDHREVTQRILGRQPGESVRLTIQRGGQRQDLAVTLGEFDLTAGRAPADAPDADDSRDAPGDGDGDGAVTPNRAETGRLGGALGFEYQSAQRATAPQLSRLGLPEGFVRPGVLVTSISARSDAFRTAGLRPGMIVTAVNDTRVTDVKTFEAAVDRARSGQPIILDLVVPNGDGGSTTFQTAVTRR